MNIATGPRYTPFAPLMGPSFNMNLSVNLGGPMSGDGFYGPMPAYAQGPALGGIFESFLGGYCPCHDRMGAQGQMMMQMLQMMSQLMQLMGAGQAGFGQGTPFSGRPSFGSPANNGGAPGPLSPVGPGAPPATSGSGHGGGSVAPAAGPAPASTSGASPVRIGPGTRVLEIGDSHSVGTFGKELDAKLRGTGAQVSTYASAGASASTFVKGTPTKYGYWEKRADGSQSSTGYGKSRATPKLEGLIGREKPHVIIVNLGANFRGSNPKSQVDQIGQIAKKHNIPIVWVGPPKTRKDNSNPASIQQFDQKMAAAVAPYGTYVPSSPHTSRYSGGDGLHYNGAQGNQIAKQWASGVFKAITG